MPADLAEIAALKKEVARSGVHAWLNRPTSTREIHDAKLVTAIETSFMARDRTHGARRVWRDILNEGLACGLHRIERLMCQNAMKARPRRRGRPASFSLSPDTAFANLRFQA